MGYRECDRCDDADCEWKEIDRHREAGHSYRCACRMVWGDGECECEKGGTEDGV